MATHGINRIVRGNLNLKPFILSKNSTDIVNGYVQRLYQQLPENFKQDLLRPRTAESQHETWTLLRNLRIPIAAVDVKSTPRTKAPPPSRPNFTSAPRKLLKTPNLKIYNKRKYTSSASSSTVSFHRHHHDERRKRLSRGWGVTTRSITGPGTAPQKQETLISRYAFIGQEAMSPRVAQEICRDLMPINAQLKKRICLSRPKAPAFETSRGETSLDGWNHPTPEHLMKFTTPFAFRKPPPISLERGLLNLMDFKKVPVKEPQLRALRDRSDSESLSKGHLTKFDNRTRRKELQVPPRSPRPTNTSCPVRINFGKPERESFRAFRKYS